MKIIAVDDMPTPRKALALAIHEAAPNAEVVVCASADDVLALSGLPSFDVAFIDIDMPEKNGIELAQNLKEINANLNIVFATGYGEYMPDAFYMHASGYIMKPITPEKVAAELENLRHLSSDARVANGGLVVRCFGDFEVFCDNEPVIFPRSKAKELLAFLIDRRGAVVSMTDIEATLWEDDNKKSRKGYLRSLVHDLRTTLEEVGHGDVIVRQHGSIGVRLGTFSCDYYDYLDGNPAVINLNHSEYMRQYTWAEITLAAL